MVIFCREEFTNEETHDAQGCALCRNIPGASQGASHAGAFKSCRNLITVLQTFLMSVIYRPFLCKIG
jgi:hypothetical protein